MTDVLVDTALGAMRLAILFTVALFLPVIIQLSLLFVAGWSFQGLVERVLPILASLFYLVGVPIHEFSHAIGALVTLCGVAAIKILFDGGANPFVEPRRWNVFGKVIASLAPLLGGALVLWLTAIYVIPNFEVPVIPPPQLDLEGASSWATVIKESIDYVGRFLGAAYQSLSYLEWANWRTWVGLYIAFSVGIAIAPSKQDFRVLVAALPLVILFVLALFVALYLSDDVERTFRTLQEFLLVPMLKFLTVVTYAFVLTSLGIFVFLPLRLLQWWRTGV